MSSNRRPSIGHWIEYLAWKTMAFGLALLPRRATVLLADALGWFGWRVLRVRRRIVLENLATAFGAEMTAAEIDRIGLRCYQDCSLTFMEFVQPSGMFAQAAALFEGMENAEHFEQVRHTAPLFLTAHIGNWEALGSYAATCNVPSVALAKPLHNPLVNAAVLAARSMSKVEVVLLPLTARKMVELLRGGKCITFLSDQDARRQGIFVDFFGKPASTATGVAVLARRTNRPVLPVFCVRLRDADRHMRALFCPPIWPDQAAPAEDDIRRITAEHVRALEDTIRLYPHCYFWLHRRWKTRPKCRRTPAAQA